MGLCNIIIDNPPNAFFMIDLYKLHGRYPITKNEEWFGFAEIDIDKITTELQGTVD